MMGSAVGKLPEDGDLDPMYDQYMSSVRAQCGSRVAMASLDSFRKTSDVTDRKPCSKISLDSFTDNLTHLSRERKAARVAEVKAKKTEDNLVLPKIWRQHKPSEVGLCQTDYVGENTSRKRFEDIPVSRMWKDPEPLVGFADENRDPYFANIQSRPVRSRRFDYDSIDKDIAEIEKNFEDGLKAENKRSRSYKRSEIDPLDAVQKFDLEAELSRFESPKKMQHSEQTITVDKFTSPLPRTYSDPVEKPSQRYSRYQSPASDNVNKLMPRTLSDPVQTRPEPYKRPATPCVSDTLSNPRHLKDYIGHRRLTECGRGPPVHNIRKREWSRPKSDFEEPETTSAEVTPPQRGNRKQNTEIPSFYSI